MSRDFLALRATKSNETTHVHCSNFNMAVSEESHRKGRSKSKMQSILNLFLCLYYLTKKQSGAAYKKAPVVMVVLI
jgi:hypothetical protein